MEDNYLEVLSKTLTIPMGKVAAAHRNRVALMEWRMLKQKHKLMRQHEAKMRNLEKKRIGNNHRLFERHCMEVFQLQWRRISATHKKAKTHVHTAFLQKEKAMLKQQLAQRISLRKRSVLKEKCRKYIFQSEWEQIQAQQEGQIKQLQDLQGDSASTMKKLEGFQSKIGKLLLEYEDLKGNQREKALNDELKAWTSQTTKKMKKLERSIARELEDEEENIPLSQLISRLG